MRKLLSIILVLGVCVGGAGAQSTWYPRSANYVTSGDFIGSGLNISGDGYIGGNLTVVGNVTAPGGDPRDDLPYDPMDDGLTIRGFLDVYGWGIVDDFTAWYSFTSRGPAIFESNATFEDDVYMETDIYVTGIIDQIGDLGDLNGGESTVVEALNATDDRLDVLETDTADNVTRIEDLEANATSQQDAIDVLDSDLATVEAAFLSEMVINVPISASSVDQFVFVSDGAWTITSVKEIHAVAGNDGSDVNFTVMVCDDGEGPDEGLMVHNSTVDLKAGAKTIQEADISGLAANVTLANNDTIAVDFQGNLATLAGGVITIEMKR